LSLLFSFLQFIFTIFLKNKANTVFI